MNRQQKRKLCKCVAMFGIMIILLPTGIPMYWGNLAVYVNSYIVVRLNTISGVEDPWIISIVILFWNVSVMVYDPVRARIGKRWTAVLCLVLIDIGILSSYWTVQTSFTLLNLTIALLPGIGCGVLHAHCLRLIVDWADKDAGLLFSIAQGSFYWGASVINQIATLYLNPANAEPSVRIANSVYFTDRNIVDKVPSLFLVLGGFSVGCHVVGYALMIDNTFDERNLQTDCEEVAVCDNLENGDGIYGGTTQREENTGNPSLNDNDASIVADYTPREVLKSGSFYALWVTYFFVELPFILLANYYKSFGQIWIHDDHFLTNLGTVLSFANIVVGLLWGFAMDKIGGRNSLILVLASCIYLSVWYYFTAMVDKWLYFIVTNFFSALTGVLFSSIALTTVALYGETHFNTNYGLLRSSAIVLSIACPFITSAFLQYFGWFYVFAFNSFSNLFGFILILFYVSRF